MNKIIRLLLLQLILIIFSIGTVKAAVCGEYFTAADDADIVGMCQCENTNLLTAQIGHGIRTQYCCGFMGGGQCRVYEESNKYGCGETKGNATVPDDYICDCDGGQWESYWQSEFWNNRGICCGWTTEDRKQCLNAPPGANDVYCGTEFNPNADPKQTCICSGQAEIDENTRCCGWLRDGVCQKTDVAINDVEVTSETLEKLNPIKIGSGSADLSTPGKIISRALKFFIFPIAGIILFIVLILGGFQMLAGANNSKSLEEGKQRITTAIIGFILLFAAYWIAQLLEIIFGIRILS